MDRSCVPCEVGCGGSGVVCAGRGGGMWRVQGGGAENNIRDVLATLFPIWCKY